VDLIRYDFNNNDKMMKIDAKRLQQVTLNLLTNAIKFSRDGGKVELGGKIVKINCENKRESYLEIFVKDTGQGISEVDKDKLFKLFGKLKQKNGINKNGIGLGLHICK
jgi:signal transduction histidine kinase